MIKTRKGEQPLVMMKMEVKIRMIVVVTAAVVIVDMTMITAAPIVMTTVEVMIAHIVEMIGVNPLVIEKMNMQIYSVKNLMMIWTTMIKILKMMLKLTDGATLMVINTMC